MVKQLWFSLLIMFVLVACSAFQYHYYGLKGAVYEHGTLLGPTDKEDLPFSACEPSLRKKSMCVVMFAGDFFAFKQDFEDTKQKLIDCQKK